MAATYKLHILSPDKVIFEGEVTSTILPGASGFFEVLARHAPIISEMAAGKVTITIQDEKKEVQIPGGFFIFEDNEGTLITN